MNCIIHIISRIKISLLFTGLFQLLLAINMEAQESMYSRKVNVYKGDTLITARLLNNSKETKTNPECFYYWFVPNEIHINQGNHSGILLHGEYCAYDKNKNLIIKGNLNYGIKTGIWISWYSDGKIKEIQNYKNGFLNGNCTKYDSSGNITISDLYDNGRLKKEHQIDQIVDDKEKTKNKRKEKNQDPENEK